jgi:hypothetical protein
MKGPVLRDENQGRPRPCVPPDSVGHGIPATGHPGPAGRWKDRERPRSGSSILESLGLLFERGSVRAPLGAHSTRATSRRAASRDRQESCAPISSVRQNLQGSERHELVRSHANARDWANRGIRQEAECVKKQTLLHPMIKKRIIRRAAC